MRKPWVVVTVAALLMSGLFCYQIIPSIDAATNLRGNSRANRRIDTDNTESGSEQPLVYVDDAYARPGRTVTIALNVANVTDLFAWQVTLNWTDDYLNFVKASEGSFLRQSGRSTFFVSPIVKQSGGNESLTLACTIMGYGAGYPLPYEPPASGQLATITLYIIAPLEGSLLDLVNVKLRDSRITPIEVSVRDGYYHLPRDGDIEPQYGEIDAVDLSSVGLNYQRNVTRATKTPTSWAIAAGSGWYNPERVVVSDDIKSAVLAQNDATKWMNFRFNTTGWTGVDTVEVGIERVIDTGQRTMRIELSHDNGTAWSPTFYDQQITETTDTMVWTDVTASYVWTETNVQGIAVKITCISVGSTVRMDYLAIRVTPTPVLSPPEIFNTDTDVNVDRTVDIDDLMYVASNYGQYALAPSPTPQTISPCISNPTGHTFSAGVTTTTSATLAYDNNNSTFAYWAYTRYPTYGGSNGYYELNLYGPTAQAPRGLSITQVDLKVVYRVITIASADATLQLSYLVNPSSTETILREPIREGTGWYNLTWVSVSEPNDGSWSWEDVSDLMFRFTRNDPGAVDSGGFMRIHEVWAVVHFEFTSQVHVYPKNQVPVPTNVKIEVTGVEELYGFEFKLTYNTTVLTATDLVLGPFLNDTAGGAPNTYGYIVTIDDATGIVWATQTILGDRRGGTVASGSWATLVTINFAVDSTGPTGINLEIKLVGLNYIAKRTYQIAYSSTLPEHDIAVTEVDASPTLITRGDTVDISVTVENEGDYLETFNVTAYAYLVSLGTQTVSNLGVNASTTLHFIWDSRPFIHGDWTIAVVATASSAETKTADNTKSSPTITVTPLLGDIDENGWVDVPDLALMQQDWGTSHHNPDWYPRSDLDRNNIIDCKDLWLLGKNWEPRP